MSTGMKGGDHYAHRHTPNCARRKNGALLPLEPGEADGELSHSSWRRPAGRADRTHDDRYR